MLALPFSLFELNTISIDKRYLGQGDHWGRRGQPESEKHFLKLTVDDFEKSDDITTIRQISFFKTDLRTFYIALSMTVSNKEIIILDGTIYLCTNCN